VTTPFVWDNTSLNVNVMTSTTKSGSAMTTMTYSDANALAQGILFMSYLTAPLTAGQTVTGAQALKYQVRASETDLGNNLFVTMSCCVIASDGTTNRKTLVDAQDSLEIAVTTLTNRQFTANSAATNYTTVAGDRLYFQIGVFGDPAGGKSHSSSMRVGDAAASDLAEDDASTTDNNPWFQLTDTLTFVAATPDTLEWRGSARQEKSRSPQWVSY
jgi:hypothetical protein